MIRLTELRKLTRRPITKLLHEAVAAYHALLTQDHSSAPAKDGREPLRIVPYHGEGKSLWYIVNPQAPEADQPCILATAKSPEEAQLVLASLAPPSTPRSAPAPSADE